RHTRSDRDWSSDVCSSDLATLSTSAERALADVESVALALRELGVQKGDRVALLSENRYEWPVIDLAVLGLGAVLVPIYPTLTPRSEERRVGKEGRAGCEGG